MESNRGEKVQGQLQFDVHTMTSNIGTYTTNNGTVVVVDTDGKTYCGPYNNYLITKLKSKNFRDSERLFVPFSNGESIANNPEQEEKMNAIINNNDNNQNVNNNLISNENQEINDLDEQAIDSNKLENENENQDEQQNNEINELNEQENINEENNDLENNDNNIQDDNIDINDLNENEEELNNENMN